MRTHQYQDIILETCYAQHLSTEDIFQSIRKIHPSIGRGTIYRNVETLYLEGKLRKIPGIDRKSYYETIGEPHAHIISESAKVLCDFSLENIQIQNIPKGYEVTEVCIHVRKI